MGSAHVKRPRPHRWGATPAMTADYYGLLAAPNIATVVYAGMAFAPWYGSPAYFSRHDHTRLGFGEGASPSAPAPAPAQTATPTATPPAPKATDPNTNVWLDQLCVCHYCFQYTSKLASLAAHLSLCDHRATTEALGGPTVGQMVYWDQNKQLIVRRVRGAHNPLFCQNLALFGKLFLDDKLVFYNVESFDFYVLWGPPTTDKNTDHLVPLGFFSKEVLLWDNTNNLACICVFPPFQRRRLGWLLIEISYAVARCTPGQFLLGPEFPLLPFGRAAYIRFWLIKLAHYLTTKLGNDANEFDLDSIARATGFRMEDILYTLSHMRVLETLENDELELRLGAVTEYCATNKIDPTIDVHVWDPEAFMLSS